MVKASQPDQIFTLSDAARLVDLPEERLIELINEGKLLSYALKTQEGMIVVVHEKDLLRATLDKGRYRQKYGTQTISLREAARRLEVAPSTVHSWVESGFIARGQAQDNNADTHWPPNASAPPLLLADVIYYQDLLRLGSLETDQPRGRLINKDGNLYHTSGRS
ncbi:MAG TPA: hypothetical protein VEA58_02880 [Anaerovoracaceae bacterium]|nr:hypothetical protein [Anaerovoracaceae bacterium]